MTTAILFSKCLGLNNTRAFSTQRTHANTGRTELIDCLNMTTTPDACLEKIAPMVPVLTHTAPVTNISAGTRFLFQDGVNTNEWDGTTVTNRFPAKTGAIAHTLLDVRVSGFKSTNPAGAMAAAVVGVYTGPAVQKPFSAMPLFSRAFIYNGILYAVNAADPRFIHHSEDFSSDLFNPADNQIGSPTPVLQAGTIPGVMLTAHADGVTVLSGMNPRDGFARKFYPCSFINGTLFSGLTSKAVGSYGDINDRAVEYNHVFLCDDGVYVVGQDGVPLNVTASQVSGFKAMNTAYTCATVRDGKYLAFGDTLAIEYDFTTKTCLKRSSFGVKAATIWNGGNYYASGSTVAMMGSEIDTGAIPCSLTLPYSDLGAPGTKSIEALYFTGIIGGEVIFTATDQTGKQWETMVDDLGTVTGYRIKTPKGILGNLVSFKIECVSGAFRMEELRCIMAAGKRSS